MMRLVTDTFEADPMVLDVPATTTADGEWPAEVDLILSAMDAGVRRPAGNRRSATRHARRVRADLRLYAMNPLDPTIPLFTRDVSATGMGFITTERLPLGYNGLVRISTGDGDTLTAACSVYRCREAIGGWYEGALHFTRRQPELG